MWYSWKVIGGWQSTDLLLLLLLLLWLSMFLEARRAVVAFLTYVGAGFWQRLQQGGVHHPWEWLGQQQVCVSTQFDRSALFQFSCRLFVSLRQHNPTIPQAHTHLRVHLASLQEVRRSRPLQPHVLLVLETGWCGVGDFVGFVLSGGLQKGFGQRRLQRLSADGCLSAQRCLPKQENRKTLK